MFSLLSLNGDGTKRRSIRSIIWTIYRIFQLAGSCIPLVGIGWLITITFLRNTFRKLKIEKEEKKNEKEEKEEKQEEEAKGVEENGEERRRDNKTNSGNL